MVRLPIYARAREVDAHARSLVVDAGSIIGQFTWLTVDIDGTGAPILGRSNCFDLVHTLKVIGAKHAHVIGNVVEDALSLGLGCRRLLRDHGRQWTAGQAP